MNTSDGELVENRVSVNKLPCPSRVKGVERWRLGMLQCLVDKVNES